VTIVIAHRGASADAPENTVAAFHLARAQGADWVELDARRTRDGKIAVHHDARLDVGTNLVEIDLDRLPATVCDLPTALDACVPMSVNIEIKNLPIDPDHDPTELVAAGVVAEVQRRRSHGEVLVSSFSRATIDRVRELDAAIPTAFLFLGPPDDDPFALAADVAAAGHVALHPYDLAVDARMMAAAREHGLAVNVWTVDDPVRMAALIDLGVDGICTNVPAVARGVVERGTGG
jgi:glycerophosphoryl diester phosphodiesterase